MPLSKPRRRARPRAFFPGLAAARAGSRISRARGGRGTVSKLRVSCVSAFLTLFSFFAVPGLAQDQNQDTRYLFSPNPYALVTNLLSLTAPSKDTSAVI